MTDIIIIGSGGHAAELDDYVGHGERKSGKRTINILGFLDDNPGNYARYGFSAPFLGGIEGHAVREDCKYVIGIGNTIARRMIVERFLQEGAQFTSFVHVDAYVSKSASYGTGVVVGPGANIGPNVSIGNFTLVNSRASIGHDSIVGKFNNLCPNVCLSGFTIVGDGNLFGINSATIPEIRVGDRNTIAAAMTLDKSIADDTVVFHRFKETVLAIPK